MVFVSVHRFFSSRTISCGCVTLAFGLCIVSALLVILFDASSGQRVALDVVSGQVAPWRRLQESREKGWTGGLRQLQEPNIQACFGRGDEVKECFQRRRAKEHDVALVYLRAAKTGSSTLLRSILTREEAECERVALFEGHAVTKTSLPHNYSTTTSFSILREPCQRFTSQVGHLRREGRLPRGNWTALRYAQFLWQRKVHRRGLRWAAGISLHLLPQRVYVGHVGSDSEVGCLPTVRSDVQRIFAKHGIGCTLPEIETRNEYSHERTSPALCKVVHKLYPEDFGLWRTHCARRSRR